VSLDSSISKVLNKCLRKNMKRLLLLYSSVLGLVSYGSDAAASCNHWSNRYQKNIDGVCVCSINSPCKSVSNEYLSLQSGKASLYTTSKSGKRLEHTVLSFSPTSDPADLIVDTSKKYQKIIGFGGAFTDAAAINVYKLKSSELQQQVIDAYFAQDGLQYTLGRVPIGSCDFSESVYSYNPVVDDFDMKNFSIEVDRATHKLDFLHRALNTTKRELSLFASSWAPPVWMTKENKVENCHIKETPDRKYWSALAAYYSKFFEAYEQEEGIKFWGMTVQNEPVHQPLQTKFWQSLRLKSHEERDFIKKELGPKMKQDHPDLKIIAMDDQKDQLRKWKDTFADPEARKYVSGVGVHWYTNLDFFFFGTGGNFDQLSTFHQKNPDLFILATEACEGFLPSWLGTGAGVRMLDGKVIWQRAENYARDIINDLANFASGWTDWNLVLDTNGGPNWAKNFVDAPIIVDEKGGEEFYLQPLYYIMGHFAKFLPKDSVRVELQLKKNSKLLDQVDHVAFVTPERRTVILFNNRKTKDVILTLKSIQTNSSELLSVTLAANSLQTVIF
jgi:glucosylceramidase